MIIHKQTNSVLRRFREMRFADMVQKAASEPRLIP